MTHSITDNQILDAALTVIANNGYAGATTRQIAAAAGINEVTLFRRFGSKKKLLGSVVEQEAENFVAAGIEYSGDVEADLRRVGPIFMEGMAEYMQPGRFDLSANSEMYVRRYLRGRVAD